MKEHLVSIQLNTRTMHHYYITSAGRQFLDARFKPGTQNLDTRITQLAYLHKHRPSTVTFISEPITQEIN